MHTFMGLPFTLIVEVLYVYYLIRVVKFVNYDLIITLGAYDESCSLDPLSYMHILIIYYHQMPNILVSRYSNPLLRP